MIIGMHADEYRRLANNFREDHGALSLSELQRLRTLAQSMGNHLLAIWVSAQIRRTKA